MITRAIFPVSNPIGNRRSAAFRLIAFLLTATAALAQSFSPGSGASTPAIAQSFIAAFNRGTFPLTTPQALGNVKTLSGASPSLVQEFGAAGANVNSPKAALIKPDPNAPVSQTDTLQVYTDIYS